MRYNEKDEASILGNINAQSLIDHFQHSWVRYFGYPKRIHVDADGVFNSNFFKQHVGSHHVIIYPCAGEAHWQNGLIERHIQTHKRTHQKLTYDDRFNELNTQEILDAASTAKNTTGVYNGFSPFQWITGSGRKHPMIDSQHIPPIESSSDMTDPFVAHLMRRQKAMQTFQKYEARSILRLARRARLRHQSQFSTGDIVYYWRTNRTNKRNTDNKRGTFNGPARVIAVEPASRPDSNARAVVWLVH